MLVHTAQPPASLRGPWGFSAASGEVPLGPALSWVGLLSSLLLAAYPRAADPVVARWAVTGPAPGSWV